jgi:hypothetical protein
MAAVRHPSSERNIVLAHQFSDFFAGKFACSRMGGRRIDGRVADWS